MGPGNKLRSADEFAARAVREEAGHARVLHNIQAGIHKLHPPKKDKGPRSVSTHTDPEQGPDNLPSRKPRTGIVSVNGRDVEEMRCTGGRRSA